MLMEEGKIALDDPVHRYHSRLRAICAVYAGGDLGGFMTAPAARPMKVIDLMRHTSGLTYGFLNRTNLDAAYPSWAWAKSDTEGGLPAHDRAAGKAAAGILAGRGLELFRRHGCAGLSGGEDFRRDISPISCADESSRRWA